MKHEHIEVKGGNRRALLITAGLTFAFLFVELVVALLTNSLALLADAIHMLTDTAALVLAAFAAWIAERPATPEKTYGYYRAEILAALANGIFLIASAGFILYEAYQRFLEPEAVAGVPMLVVAAIGLGVNLVGIWILRSGAKANLNVRGAFYEVVKDALGSVGVIVAGVVILTTGWQPIDPLVSALIALFILPRTWTLLSEAVDVLLEGTPSNINLAAMRQVMLAVEGVAEVHDLHVWTISSGFVAMSAHVVLAEGVRRDREQAILLALNERLQENFAVGHTTIQLEYQDLREMEHVP